jgi:hypothetical protein
MWLPRIDQRYDQKIRLKWHSFLFSCKNSQPFVSDTLDGMSDLAKIGIKTASIIFTVKGG